MISIPQNQCQIGICDFNNRKEEKSGIPSPFYEHQHLKLRIKGVVGVSKKKENDFKVKNKNNRLMEK